MRSWIHLLLRKIFDDAPLVLSSAITLIDILEEMKELTFFLLPFTGMGGTSIMRSGGFASNSSANLTPRVQASRVCP
jgi:hypothetical protein